ncbi:prolipoprotein diacylglyceryl transferase [Candidatus Dependentiae bacterium]|nr:prolipoprotein diacylglyceryl transferase [Candidatus Dependentiae bacterium]
MHRILFEIGQLKIYSYGFLVAMGFFIGFLLALKKAKKDNLDEDAMYSIIILIIVSALIGGRVFYIILNWKHFLADPKVYIFSREGFVFLGGFVFGVIAAIIFAVIKKIPVWKLADTLAPSIAFGHGIGRLGCFLNGCCYGKPGGGFLSMVFPADSIAGYFHPYEGLIPTQLISSLGNFIIFIILTMIYRKKTFDGQVFFMYFIIYSMFRFVIEFFRGDYSSIQYYIFNLTISQITGFFLLAFGLSMFFFLKHKQKTAQQELNNEATI